MKVIRSLRRINLIVAALAVGLVGCSVEAPVGSTGVTGAQERAETPTTTETAAPTAAPEPCQTAAATPIPEASLPTSLDEETREAIRVRTDYGLRRDLAWVREVADDPTAVMDFGVSMLPAETASLFARNELGGPVQAALADHGHTEEFGGLYIDNAQGGVVVVLWTSDPAVHEAAIRPELPACHPVQFRQVRWSEQELRQWQDRVSADVDWMSEIPAIIQSVGVRIESNVVSVGVSSAESDAAERILAHYDAPAGMIRVQSDGTGAALLPYGTVVGRVLLADGRPPGPNDLMLDAGSPDDPPGLCGRGDIGYGVREDGRIEYPCKAGRRTILVKDWSADDEHLVVAETVVDVPANGEVAVEIRLPKGFDPASTP